MIDFDQSFVWIGALILLLCAILILRWNSRHKAIDSRRRFLMTMLETALFQKTAFDIKRADGSSHSGLSASLDAISSGTLSMLANGFVADEWDNKPVEAFFRVTQPEGPVFFVFNSVITDLRPGSEFSTLNLAMPEHLRVEKKRHFVRVAPDPKDILMLAIWPVGSGRRLPRTNADMGQPALSCKNGQPGESVQIENISGGGIALRFYASEKGELPLPSAKGRQLICLLVYRPGPDAPKPVIFWCSGEIMNARKIGYATALGLEFTNWAVQEQGDTQIHWAHSSPWQGVKPILAWVDQIERQKK